jgi:hypothetical protein
MYRGTPSDAAAQVICESQNNCGAKNLSFSCTHLLWRIDGRCAVADFVRSQAEKEGAGTIPTKTLLEFVRLPPEGEIRLLAQIRQTGWHGDQ